MKVLRAQDVSQGGLCIILMIIMMIKMLIVMMMIMIMKIMMMMTCAKRRVDEWQSSTFATLTVAFETLFNTFIVTINVEIGCYGGRW